MTRENLESLQKRLALNNDERMREINQEVDQVRHDHADFYRGQLMMDQRHLQNKLTLKIDYLF